MIYAWDTKHRNDTFRMCLDTLNKAKGYDVNFDFIETDSKKLTLLIEVQERHYTVYFWWEDLAKVVGKAGQDIDFEKLTERQYLKLCEYIISEVWRVAKMVYRKD